MIGAAIYISKVVVSLRGVLPRECSICGHKGRFRAAGFPPRLDAMCPKCASFERHRLLKLLLVGAPDIVSGKDVLHFAPESCVTSLVKSMASTHITADIDGHSVDLALNIESMPSVEGHSFDLVICAHVLEHVDDGPALHEMHRILRPGGIALIMTPVIEGWAKTYENPLVTSPEARFAHFGQKDHVRYFGSDLRCRITSAGFLLEEFTAEEPDVLRYGLLRGEKVFIARKI
jgi:SAM-dependent methyltransferase